jgi:signal transduction histidine kinase
MLALEVMRGPDRGRRFELPAHEPQLIGRSSEALPITDTSVSRRHAELTPDEGAWWIRDLESSNGTYVNGRRIHERTRLDPGDQVRCGSSLFVLTGRADEAPTAPPVRLLDEDELDVTIESSGDPNADSLILAAPDPVVAASDHLRVLTDVVAIASETIATDALLGRVMDLVMAEFRADRGFILLGDLDRGPLQMAQERHREPVIPGAGGGPGGGGGDGPGVGGRTSGERIPVSRTIIRHVRETGQGVLSTNAMNDRRFASGDSVAAYGIRSAVCVPISGGGPTYGVIHIDSQLANFTFTDQQFSLLQSVGRLTAMALHSRELVEAHVRDERLAAMGHTVASLSHSIKNILQGLRGGADAIELALNKDDLALAREGWPILARNLDRILNLTLNMLAYSRETGVDTELIDAGELIEDARELIARHCDARRIALVVDHDEHMPPVPADPVGMHQVLMNLLMNAVEAAPSKRGVVTIGTSFDAGGGRWELRVSDNGPGMTAAERARAFVPFATTKGQRGTGLGLAVTRKIVEEHGGRVVLESEPDVGTSVRVIMPIEVSRTDLNATQYPGEGPP